MGQAFGSPLLVLEISGPFQGIAFGELYLPLHFPLGFSHGATHVAAPDREFHGAETSVVIPVDNQRAGNRMDIRQLADRNHGTILSSDLLKIPETIRLSRLTVKTIRQNLFWAFIYNLVSIPIAAGILYPVCGFLLNPMIGGAAMAFSSVSVVSNSLRLKRKKISLIPRGNEVRIEEVEPINKKVMKKRFTIDGMMCGHCRAHVEEALNSIDGVKAIVTLDPPEATIEFADKEISLNELQQIVQNKAGDYKLHDSK